jgi:formylglycine-generating enzyme required for sulfatase activity
MKKIFLKTTLLIPSILVFPFGCSLNQPNLLSANYSIKKSNNSKTQEQAILRRSNTKIRIKFTPHQIVSKSNFAIKFLPDTTEKIVIQIRTEDMKTILSSQGEVIDDIQLNITDEMRQAGEVETLLNDLPVGISLSINIMAFENNNIIAQKKTNIMIRSSEEILGADQKTISLDSIFTDNFGMEFKYIPPGSFNMGSQDGIGYDNEHPQHMVHISNGFYMQTTELTQGHWKNITGFTPSSQGLATANSFPYALGDMYPLYNMSWVKIQSFLAFLNSQAQGYYRLPTEAEWEYAARAGTETKYSCETNGNSSDCVESIAWTNENAFTLVDNYTGFEGQTVKIYGTLQKVKQKNPNYWGLYDMLGNVSEIVNDKYAPYSATEQTDPTGSISGSQAVFRGGSTSHPLLQTTSSARFNCDLSKSFDTLGFRLIYEKPQINTAPHIPVCNDCPQTLISGTTRNFVFHLNDPDGNLVNLSINWGDGSPIENSIPVEGDGSVSISHHYLEGNYSVSVTAWDEQGLSSIPLNFSLNVVSDTNPPPDDTLCVICPTIGEVGQTLNYTFLANSTLPESLLKVSVNWGDGTTPLPESNTITGSGNVNINHIYSDPGIYNIHVTTWNSNGTRSSGDLVKTIIISPQDIFTNSFGMKFKYIKPGTFLMGSLWNFYPALHEVTLTKGYYIQTTELTKKQWFDVMGSFPYPDAPIVQTGADDHPMFSLSWNDTQAFLNVLNQKGQGTYRLPTEAEWEYAARAGTKTTYPCLENGENENCLDSIAWYAGNSDLKIHRVALKAPNPWGLYDMLGNVSEWVKDYYAEFEGTPVTDPVGPLTAPSITGGSRVIRGGSSLNDAGLYSISTSKRSHTQPSTLGMGFRIIYAP